MSWRDADDDLDEAEYPDEFEADDDASETYPCPHCFHTVYEDAERCPGCGEYLSAEDIPKRPPWWVLAGVAACLTVIARWIVG